MINISDNDMTLNIVLEDFNPSIVEEILTVE